MPLPLVSSCAMESPHRFRPYLDVATHPRAWLDPEGATEAEPKNRTLTNLYNTRPTLLQHAHAALDRAVWIAYGWDDPVPAEVDSPPRLARLLALNLGRSSEA